MGGLFGGGSSKSKDTKTLYPPGTFTTDADGNHLHSPQDTRVSAPGESYSAFGGEGTILGGGMFEDDKKKSGKYTSGSGFGG